MELYKAAWSGLHRAESRLVSAGVKSNPDLLSIFFDDCLLPRFDFSLLFRLASGFDPARLSPKDFLRRYPFSTLDQVREKFSTLSGSGCLKYKRKVYSLSETGWELVHGYYNVIAGGIDRLVLESVSTREIEYLLQVDRRLVEGCASADASYGQPNLQNRLRGYRPVNGQPRLSHHWQRVWTLIAAREDAEEAVRRSVGLDPLVWFARRQIRTGRFEIGSAADLVRIAGRYAPVGEAACHAALEALTATGWIRHDGEIFCLTVDGQDAVEQDELEIDRLFFAGWPELNGADLDRLVDITSRLNTELAG